MRIYFSILFFTFSSIVCFGQQTFPGQATDSVVVKSADRVVSSTFWVLTNSTLNNYVYASGSNGFFSKAGGSGMLQSIVISGATNMQGTIHLFGYPPLTTTNGTIWSNDLFGQGATNRMGPPRQMIQTGVAGTNYLVSVDANIPVINRDNTTNIYWVITASSTAVTNYPGTYGTNYVITFSGIDDSLRN